MTTNEIGRKMKKKFQDAKDNNTFPEPTTIGEELEYNPFLMVSTGDEEKINKISSKLRVNTSDPAVILMNIRVQKNNFIPK